MRSSIARSLVVSCVLFAGKVHSQTKNGYSIAASCSGFPQVGSPICGGSFPGEKCTKEIIEESCVSESQACCCDGDGSCSDGSDSVCCFTPETAGDEMLSKSALPSQEKYEVKSVSGESLDKVPTSGPPKCALGCVSYFMSQNGDKAPTTIEEQCDFLVNYALGLGCEQAGVGIDCDESDMEGLNDILAMCNTGNTPTSAFPADSIDYDDDDSVDDDMSAVVAAGAGEHTFGGEDEEEPASKSTPAGVVVFITALVLFTVLMMVYVFNKRQRDFYQSGWIVNAESGHMATPVAGNINVSVL